MKNYTRILTAIHTRPWAITEEGFDMICRIVEHPPQDLEAVASRLGKPLENGGNRVEKRGRTAVLGVTGPIFRYANILTDISGATSIQQLALDFQAALDDEEIDDIVLDVDSPGGQVDGVNELADAIRAGNTQKPVTAYVGSMAASAAYWLASAAGSIVANESAQLGSIGVLASIIDRRPAQERQGIRQYDIISSQSPYKNMDPATDAGKAQIQATVDEIAQLFIERVARFRGVAVDTVLEGFGKGSMLPARRAIGAGMADRLGAFEPMLAEMHPPDQMPMPMRGRLIVGAAGVPAPKAEAPFSETELEQGTEEVELNDDKTCQCPEGEECTCGNGGDDESEGTEQEPDEGSEPEAKEHQMDVKQDRERIEAILSCEEAKGRETLAQKLALKTDMPVEAAREMLAAAPVSAPAAAPNPLEQRMGALPNPVVGVPGDATESDSPAAEAQRILAFIPKERRRNAA